MDKSASSGGSAAGRGGADSSGQRGTATLQPSVEDMKGTWDDARGNLEDAADSLGDSIREAARTTTRAVREQASSFASDIGEELGATAEQQKQRGVESMQGFVHAINTAAAELDQQSPMLAGYVRDAAEKIGRLSHDIGNRDVQDLMRSASDLARSQPMLFFGGAVVAGFALSRFLKSSSSDRDRPARSGSTMQRMGNVS